MYIIKVIPIASNLPDRYFSYFSKEKYNIGSLVEIKIKNRKIFGIIKDSIDAKREKINIKGEKFTLKKIENVINNNFLNKDIISILENISYLYGGNESELIENFLPKYILEENQNLFQNKIIENKLTKNNKINTFNKVKILDFEERINFYKKEIIENLKNKNSLVIFSPTINDIENLKNKLEIDFKENILIFNSKNTKKEIRENFQKIFDNKNKKEAFVILSTISISPFILKDKLNLNTIIIDKENSYNYFLHSSKRQIDGRNIIEYFTKSLNLNLFKSGNLTSLDTYKSLNKNQKDNIFDNKDQINHSLNIEIIDRVKEKEIINLNKNKKYSSIYFSDEIINNLEEFKKKKAGKIFFFTKRKGLFTETICSDCGSILECESCHKPLVLFEKEGKRIYVCSKCKYRLELRKDENLTCKNCASWRMQTIGIATSGIAENLKDLGFNTHIIDSENTKSIKKIKDTISSWQNEDLSILIATDLALAYLDENINIDFSSIISIDSLFSIPEMNIDEKIFNLLLDINEKVKTKEKILIQTRLIDSNIWQYIKDNNRKGFLDDEIENRKAFNLPPYSNVIKFKINKKDLKLKDNIERLIQKICNEEKVSISKINFKEEAHTGNVIGMFLVRKDFWEMEVENVNEEKNYISLPTNFAKKIHSLLTDFKIEINPQNVY